MIVWTGYFANLSEGVGYAYSQNLISKDVFADGCKLVDKYNSSKHSDWLKRGLPVDTVVKCFHAGSWHHGVVRDSWQQSEQEFLYHVEWWVPWDDPNDCSHGRFWFGYEHLRHAVLEVCNF